MDAYYVCCMRATKFYFFCLEKMTKRKNMPFKYPNSFPRGKYIFWAKMNAEGKSTKKFSKKRA